jgi:hypothetical protein
VSDPAKGALRTISGWANLRKHPSLNRALAEMTFHFGAPYFIKSIDYDLAALDAARKDTTPDNAQAGLQNDTSVEQAGVPKVEVSRRPRELQQSFCLTFGAEAFAEASIKWRRWAEERSGDTVTTSGRSFSTRGEADKWSVIRVRRTRIVQPRPGSTASASFTYTVAWYGTSSIKKEVVL